MTYAAEAIILGIMQYRDFDRIYTVYTREFGKLTLLARGANRIKSKLAGHIEIGVHSSIMFASGKGFDILAQARSLESFAAARMDAHKLIVLCALVEIIDKLTESRNEDAAVFQLLSRALYKLSENTRNNTRDFLYHYFLHLLILLGHAPNMKDEPVLQKLLIADISDDGILVEENARRVINGYARQALDEKQLYCFDYGFINK